ncbi:1,3-beta-glucanosyltransferase gel3 [Coccidioides posadasii str. Silveira]|uniref:1,3-beta-glucanosyltransferase n=2 Tax=Coccidioides posadasii TaxID=199306 RepID=E9CZI6_COCPS|nr:1,3-beta-glucanosyltransferase gel3 [Coccidioides posadasii str. Silveira]KMM72808.1 EPD1 protein [Coccidioides posadasii RMSCC 3488]
MRLPSVSALAAFVAILIQSQDAFAISRISAVGSKFFNEEGEQFFVKGNAYQLTPQDPLVNTTQCYLDVKLMKELGANAIRVYHVNPDGDHAGCMKAFADAGIYLFVDLDDFPTQIDQNHPAWEAAQFDAFKRTLDEFQQFEDTAAVFVGNELLNAKNGSHAAPYVLAAARDIKAYRDPKRYRNIPVRYSAADIAALRPMLQNYLVCRSNASETLVFFALNAYEWCGDSTYTRSGYLNLLKQAEGFPVPILFSETGCNTVRPRVFQDLTAIYGPKMVGTWSGAVVYEWIQEANDDGLITYGKASQQDDEKDPSDTVVVDGYFRQGKPKPIIPDFPNSKSRWATLTPTGVNLSDYSRKASSVIAPPRPDSTSGWNVDPSAELPILDEPIATLTAELKPTQTADGAAPSHKNSASQLLSSPTSGTTIFSLMVGALIALGGIIGWLL